MNSGAGTVSAIPLRNSPIAAWLVWTAPKEPPQLGRWRLQARRIVEVLAVARDTQWS
jgi:hypothetical protein